MVLRLMRMKAAPSDSVSAVKLAAATSSPSAK